MGTSDPNERPTLTSEELAQLRFAKSLLENPGLAARLAHTIGSPIEKGFEMLPQGWSDTIQKVTYKALLKCLKIAALTLEKREGQGASSDLLHKLMVGASGGVGGALGFVSLPLELPFSTTLMLRSIADIARSEGHDAGRLETKLACLEVFALGGTSSQDDAAENAYWAVRAALAKAVSEATTYIAHRGIAEESAPAIVRFLTAIASRFGLIVSKQIAAKAVPVAGALAGSAVNVIFLDHFQKMARGHFIVKRLENKYDPELVKSLYDSIAVPLEL
jgi:hypothetical protein